MLDIRPFSLSPLPQIVFGAGVIAQLPELILRFGTRVVLVTGARSFTATPHWRALTETLRAADVQWEVVRITGEPSPQVIDGAVRQCRATGAPYHIVIGIGGGSVLDAGKAIAGLLPSGDSVMNYLEGVGRGLTYRGPALPYIAVPTTAGTGSEATKNAVLSVGGSNGYKKSFRDDQLVPRFAVVDPMLLSTLPRAQIAANGMDAFTQLLEALVSANANPFIDTLAYHGIEIFYASFFTALAGEDDPQARAGTAYAALLSGIALAQVGLGSVHGIASPLGAFFPVPHGVACGTLLATATATNIRALQTRASQHPALEKYARVGRLLNGDAQLDTHDACAALCAKLNEWERHTAMPPLREYGVTDADVARIAAHSRGNSMKTNPIMLTDQEVASIVRARL